MPTIIDATVVASAYDTSGNGGRKLVMLDNGWLVASVYDSSGSNVRFYVDKQDGSGFINPTISYTQISSSFDGQCIVAVGNIVYAFQNANGNIYMRKYDVTAGTIDTNGQIVDSGQSDGNGLSVVSNESGTELHATWASKNSTYSNSFNIRYAKGTINADGSVTWGAVEQITTLNISSYLAEDPSITVKDDIPYILCRMDLGNEGIICLSPNIITKDNSTATWGNKYVNTFSPYIQFSPSAIFVPQSVNGLANGRIWVTWHGKDSVDTTMHNVRLSYSDDSGATWSAMQKLTSGNTYSQVFATITTNKNNEVFVLWYGLVLNTSTLQVRQLKNTNGSWGSIVNKTMMTSTNNVAGGQPSPSSLFDLTMNLTEPLFIYRNYDNTKVGFYGTWTITTISVTQGAIGQKTDKANLLTYSIMTDGTMSTITEKVNGVITGTKTATSGQSLIAGLSQAQWDLIKYGKYANVTGGNNTLTVEMGTELWTYTFDKRLATDDDILSAVKATQDAQSIVIPNVKTQLVEKIGGLSTDSFEDIIANGNYGKKWASGSFSKNFLGYETYVVSGVSFKPSVVKVNFYDGTTGYSMRLNNHGYEQAMYSTASTTALQVVTLNNDGFTLKMGSYTRTYDVEWEAIE